jgi:uncharacterized membrane protein YeaQ/YmgE (transglycosylase-associated protein family)
MLLLLTNIWLAGNKMAFFLLQAGRDRRGSSATEDFSTWGTTYKMKWSTLLVIVVIGLIAGALARLLMPGKDPMGFIMTIILGIAGSFVGGFIASLIWKNETGTFHPGGLLLSVLGAILLLFLLRMMRRN